MEFFNPKTKRARQLFDQAQALQNDGMEDDALAAYKKSIKLNSRRSAAWYNIGLIYKYRQEWQASLEYNQRAFELAPDDEAVCWNLAIAATALARWDIARACWLARGMTLEGESGPINMNFGMAPVRLNPDDKGEVVWATRICPVRARIDNIPFPESGFRYGDIVLHDGAATGYRESRGREYPVFNVFQCVEASRYETWIAMVEIAHDDDLAQLEALFGATPHEFEDWTRNTRTLCRQCSEGRPHEQHDHDLKPDWQKERRLGLAIQDGQDISALFATWQQQCGARLLKLEHGGQALAVVH